MHIGHYYVHGLKTAGAEAEHNYSQRLGDNTLNNKQLLVIGVCSLQTDCEESTCWSHILPPPYQNVKTSRRTGFVYGILNPGGYGSQSTNPTVQLTKHFLCCCSL